MPPAKSKKEHRPVGITELARKFGVNVGTISRALNQKPGVGKALREKIIAKANSLNYQPNVFARALRAKGTGTIGIIGGMGQRSVFENPFWARILAGVEEQSRKSGYDLLISSSEALEDFQKEDIPQFLKSRRVDGVVAINCISPKVLKFLHKASIPCVQIDFIGDTHFPAILSEHEEGAFAATEHLIGLGHRNLLFVGNPWRHENYRSRAIGFKKAVRKHGVQGMSFTRPQAVQFNKNLASYRTLLIPFLKKNRGLTAIFCQNDESAIHTKTILMNEGVKIPDQMSIMGFDDIQISENIYPPLTTMRVEKRSIGRRAFELLLNCVSSEKAFPKGLVERFAASLVIRGSTASPRKGKLSF